jgi:hypothetical protein
MTMSLPALLTATVVLRLWPASEMPWILLLPVWTWLAMLAGWSTQDCKSVVRHESVPIRFFFRK